MIVKNIKCDCNSCKTDKEASHQKEDRTTVWPKAKGHLDTQLFPECEGTKYDRDIVKKTVNERKKKGKIKKAFSSGYEYKFNSEITTPKRCNNCGQHLGDISDAEWNKMGKNCDECILLNDAPAPVELPKEDDLIPAEIKSTSFSINYITKIADASRVRDVMDGIDRLMENENSFKNHNTDIPAMDEATTEDLDEGYGRGMSYQDYQDSLETPEITVTSYQNRFTFMFHGNYEPSSVNAGTLRKVFLTELDQVDALALVNLIQSKKYNIYVSDDAKQKLGV